MKLRPYQLQAVRNARASIKRDGIVLLVSPSGAGKAKPRP
jgi:superfamily II DNA or RNA helicase